MVRIWDATTGKKLLNLPGHKKGISNVSFSPNGQRLASASLDQTVRIWDAATGKELLTLKGHTGFVREVSFSPDGQRLASCGDGTVRVWDAATGKELLALKRHTGSAVCVAFSPDSRRLAAAGWNAEEGGVGKVWIWETSPIPDNVWRRRELVDQVASLFEELGLRDEVLATLGKNPALSKADREFALQVAQKHPENAEQLNEAAWRVVKSCDAGKDAYAFALHHAEAAVRLAPHNRNFLTTLGISQYRAGRYADALVTLTKAEKLNTTTEDSDPTDLAFLAMAQHQLGKKDEANATLDRLRKVMQQSRWAKDAEAVSFLREAEELIEGKAVDKKE
jgi:tetratricopeptide (TPR) repeat protein